MGRQRQPNVAVEFPMVVCAQLEAGEDMQRQLLHMLSHITGTSKLPAPVRPHTRWNAARDIPVWSRCESRVFSMCAHATGRG
jgi:hypothetical protein